MTTLFVAAGGGGDAVGILLAKRVLDPEGDGPALISTCAWERLRVDPIPGPRPISGFSGLRDIGGQTVEVLPTSDTVPPGRSMLPRLAAEADARIFLHDFQGGARGLARQLDYLARVVDADRIVVVDVGGDVMATGQEPNLLSPLADSLTLAAALDAGIPVDLAVLGPGTDAELMETEVIHRLAELGARVVGNVSPEDVQKCSSVLDWHPTEATALVATSALGVRGQVEMRRGNRLTPLTDHGCQIWLHARPRLDDFPLSFAVSNTTDLERAEQVVGRLAVNEIAYERSKAFDLSIPRDRPARSLKEAAQMALSKGATHITTRRLLEQVRRESSGATLAPVQFDSLRGRTGALWDLETLCECLS